MRKKACPTHDKPDNGDVYYTDRLLFVHIYTVQFFVLVQCFSLLSLIVVLYIFSVDLFDMSQKYSRLGTPCQCVERINAYENLEIHVEHFLQNSIDRGVQACKDVSTPIIKLSYENALLIDRPMAQHRKKSINCMDQTVGHIFFSELKTQCFYRRYLIF